MKSIFRWIIVVAALLVAGCQPDRQTSPVFLATASATAAPSATQTPTATEPATVTPIPPTPLPSPTVDTQVLGGQVWNAENAASAQATDFLLPDYPVGLYWPANAKVFVYLNSKLLEIYLDPVTIGVTIPVNAPGNVLGIAPDASSLVYQGGDGGLFLWSRASQSSETIPFGGAAYFASYSPDGQTIAIGSTDTWKVTLYDRATMKPFQTLTGFETAAPVYSALPGPNRGTLAWIARGKLQFQDIETSALGGERGYQDFIMGISFDPVTDQVAVISGGLLQVIHSSIKSDENGQDLLVSPLETPITSVVFSPDGKLLAAGVGSDVVVWNTADWSQVAQIPQATQVRLISFSPDGRVLATVDDSKLLKVWRIP